MNKPALYFECIELSGILSRQQLPPITQMCQSSPINRDVALHLMAEWACDAQTRRPR